MQLRQTRTQTPCLLVWGIVAALLSQNLVFTVFSATHNNNNNFQDAKNFFLPPFPGVGSSPPSIVLSPPIASNDPTTSPPAIQDPSSSPPPVGGGGGYSYSTPPPTHGSGSGSTPAPVHHTPSHGGHGGHHGHGGSPPTNCGNPTTPHHPSPPRHVDPSPPHHTYPSPAPPTGGYHYNVPPPTGGGGGGGSTPSSPPIILPPTTPGLPSPPYDPNSPPIGGTCDFWRNHPGIIWGLFGWWGPTIGSTFGVGTLPGTGANLNLLQALSNTRTDGIGALCREGTASLLNSMVNKRFPFTTSHVKASFVAAVGSNKAAAAQAQVFKLANEGHMKLRD